MLAIKYRWHMPPDELRMLYSDAEEAMEEVSTQRYNDESNFDMVVRNTGLLVLDNFGKLAGKHATLAASIVCARSDKGRVTVIVGKSLGELQEFDESLKRRVAEGKTVFL